MCRFYIVCSYLYCRWRSDYQEGINWDDINRFNIAILFRVSQSRNYISSGICNGRFLT